MRNRFQGMARVAAICALFACGRAMAHPMGNFSISHYAGIHLRQDSVELEYLIDEAEIPAFQEMQQGGLTAEAGSAATGAFLVTKAAEFGEKLSLTVNGHPLVLRPVTREVIFPQGAGGLSTMKMRFVYRAGLNGECREASCELVYADVNFAERAGWKEIVVSHDAGVRVDGAAEWEHDRSARLTDYPTDLVKSPPQDVVAKFGFRVDAPLVTKTFAPPVTVALEPGVPAAAPAVELKANRQAPPRNSFTELMTRKDISLGFSLLAALIAAGLGALHALEPGHGKTIVAAYLVGSKGTARHAMLLGLIVTVSHTAGVYLLGGVTLYAQKYIMPDRLYPFLSVISGVLIAGMGIYILLKRFMGDDFSFEHSHGPFRHSHSPEFLHDPAQVALPAGGGIGRKQLAILGITGGMVPCPAALVVLLSAVALHRVGFGLFLIVAFSVGLAAVLIGMGLVAVYAGKLMARVPVEGKMIQLWMPAASAAMITLLGFGIAVRGLMAAGIVKFQI